MQLVRDTATLVISDQHQLAGQRTKCGFGVFTPLDLVQKLTILALKFSSACLYMKFKLLPEAFVFGNLGLESLSLLLQLSDSAKALIFTAKTHVAFGRNYCRMFVADFQQQPCVFLAVETAHGIGAEEREGFSTAQFVPEFLQTDRSVSLSFRPQQRDHFAKNCNSRMHARRTGKSFSNDPADNPMEKLFVRPRIPHECLKKLCCIRDKQTFLLDKRGKIQPLGRQPFQKAVTVSLCGNHNSGIASPQCVADIFAQFLE